MRLTYNFLLCFVSLTVFPEEIGKVTNFPFLSGDLGNNWPVNLSESDTFLRIILLLFYFSVVITYSGSQKIVY